MRTFALSTTLLLAASPIGDPEPARGPDLAIHCGRLIVAANTAPIADCWLIVRNGKVAAIQRDGEPPADLTVVDATDKVVMPGLIAADSDLSGHGDDQYTVTPDFVALDGFDFLRDYELALSGGVTTVYLAPGRNRLIPGQGSVVKLAGDDMVQRVLAENACLRITLGQASINAPPLFEPTPFPTAEDPLTGARRQYPSARISQLATLRQLFRDAQTAPEDVPTGPGNIEDRFDGAALRAVALGQLPLRIAARGAADVRRALQFAAELGQRAVLENPAEVAPIASQLAGAAVVFRSSVNLSAPNAGGENRLDETPTDRPENPGIAARAGAKVAIAPNRNRDLADMLLLAAIAVRHGLPANQAIASVTSNAAEILGVGDRVGSLEVGKDADFVVLSGEPLAVGSMIEQTWIDGTRVYERHTESTLIAIRATRIITGTGDSIRDGVVLVANGKIKSVGTELAIPYGARVIDVDGVVVPGFIDADSTLGLSGDGTGVPTGAADQRVADAIAADDPSFADARAAGITTVLVSGQDSGLVSGRIAAVKTGAADHASMVLREIAGVRFLFDAIGPDAIKPLAAELQKGKAYIEAWQKYEKALADWQAGKGQKPAESKPAEAPVADDPIGGTWECEMEIPQLGRAMQIVFVLKLEGTTVTGTAVVTIGDRTLPEQSLENGKFENGELRADLQFMRNSSTMVAKIANDTLDGTVQAMGQDVKITGRRTAKAGEARPAKAGAEDDGRPKKPNVDEAMESMRALLEKRATAVVRVDRAPAIEAVNKLMTDEGISFVLQDVGDLVDTPSLLANAHVMVGPELVMRDKGEVVNSPARLADAGATVAIVTGDNAGSRFLPLHAMHAIRYGLDPDSALQALTIAPARLFGIDDRVGSIERGKDADLVIYSGGPFEPSSRVLLVMCNGRIVHDAREGGSR